MWFLIKDKYVFGMAFMRVFSGCIEISAALLMLYFNRVETAVKINAGLALVGPIILFLVMSLGLLGLAGKLPISKMVYVLLGVALIFYGVNKG
ncbi:YqhV family protein [Metallumcola ferriviriculae]|uniref:YqhV family protein n=1 Tax=Metallumcola ferriviriculae TaxID=3039180 RepID=A0AAU0UKE4_9FIRM|nr:YqhV family protein [Desulfitibacteraceae bacterium MK1]